MQAEGDLTLLTKILEASRDGLEFVVALVNCPYLGLHHSSCVTAAWHLWIKHLQDLKMSSFINEVCGQCDGIGLACLCNPPYTFPRYYLKYDLICLEFLLETVNR